VRGEIFDGARALLRVEAQVDLALRGRDHAGRAAAPARLGRRRGQRELVARRLLVENVAAGGRVVVGLGRLAAREAVEARALEGGGEEGRVAVADPSAVAARAADQWRGRRAGRERARAVEAPALMQRDASKALARLDLTQHLDQPVGRERDDCGAWRCVVCGCERATDARGVAERAGVRSGV
jgi:hypothetical protein